MSDTRQDQDYFWNEAAIKSHIAAYTALVKAGRVDAASEYFRVNLYLPFMSLIAAVYLRLKDTRFLGEIEDAQQAIIVQLLPFIPMYDPTKKAQAMTWFWEIIKNRLVNLSRFNTKRTRDIRANIPLNDITEDLASACLARAPWAHDSASTNDCDRKTRFLLEFWTEAKLKRHFKGKSLVAVRALLKVLRNGSGPKDGGSLRQTDIAAASGLNRQTVSNAIKRMGKLTVLAFREDC